MTKKLLAPATAANVIFSQKMGSCLGVLDAQKWMNRDEAGEVPTEQASNTKCFSEQLVEVPALPQFNRALATQKPAGS